MLCVAYVDVFVSLNGAVILNGGYVFISDIGFTDDTALLCHTNRPPSYGGPYNSGGEWYGPHGTRVDATAVPGPGFRRDRGPKVVRLKRRTGTGSPQEGIYRCSIQDAALVRHTVYVGLYNRGGGNNGY